MATNNATNTSNPITVAQGGTGRNTLTDHGVLVGATTSAITQLTAGTNGQLLVGSTGADPVFATPGSTDSTVTWTTGAGTLSAQVNQANLTSVAGAKLFLIQSQTASSSASLVFTSGLTYTNMLIVFQGMVPATNGASLYMLTSTDAGVSYDVTGYFSGLNKSAYNSATLANLNSTTEVILSGPIDSARYASGYVYGFGVGGNFFPHFVGESFWLDQGTSLRTYGTIGASSEQNFPVNAIKFLMSSGNIASGTVSLFGLKVS